MRFSKYYIKTLKETPKEAEIVSHKLLLRAGMIKKLASGVYTYLPMGYRTLRKVENIVREEMNKAGAVELFMPVLQPAEIWQESGRWDVMGAEMIRLKDRHERDFVLGPTHEEVITDIVRSDIFSYKALPINLYQIQTKFRDERRPRFGLMRGREFLMKDGYSFSVDRAGLDKEFDNMQQAYSKIFSRCGLDFRIVDADSGAIGGSGSKEFHVMANSGEDELIFCDSCHYGANVEKATNVITNLPKEELKEPVLVPTPNIAKIEDVVKSLEVEIERTVKAIMYKDVVNDKPYMVLIRGDIEVNEVKVKNLIDTIDIVMLTDEEIEKLGLFKGFIGPYGLDLKSKGITVIADESVVNIPNHTAGGNQKDTHYLNVNYGRDYTADIVADVRKVKEGDICSICGKPLRVARGIECGHIFKLGKKYSTPMHAVVLDENGKEVVMEMGCYGIGISRTMSAAIEQNNDENGIIWPTAIAPFIVDVIATNMKDEAQVSLAEELHNLLEENGIETIYDDRNERAGFKFKDADLIGFPFKVVCGKKSSEGIVELKIRRTNETIEIEKSKVVETVKELMKKY
ncbi:MAG: proline--tRNA ligase [Fusobacterium perfoetens]|uniref:proline--tRNA ligase n=1 Tax=Fusobacterium perfoetens TaxID=852 RepID=UPI0023F403CF|nr:proline--tRNA ligase [Fusobacterium perfoetens]MCI6151768.1 proline--tRNA ligase [Fusobacterium perfoetens]MDY3236871.1 proline--tRNA ligase [Fusobacterium perfoetens]